MATHKWITRSLSFFAAVLLARGSVASGVPTPTLRDALLRVAAMEVNSLAARLAPPRCWLPDCASSHTSASSCGAFEEHCSPENGNAACRCAPPASPACSLKEPEGVGVAEARSQLSGRAIIALRPRSPRPRQAGGARLLWVQAAASSLNVLHVRLQI
jgi:hypothetical protein